MIPGVSEWQSKIIESLPEELASSLPSIELLEAELADERANVASKGRAPAVEAQPNP